jgi:hypothetical protein
MPKRAPLFFALALALPVAACSKSEPAPSASASAAPERAAPPERGPAGPRGRPGAGAAKELNWADPPEWTKQPPSGMRVAQYKVPRAAGDTDDGECTVVFLGKNSTVDENVDRWVGQFDQGKLESRTASEVAGMKVTTVEVSGGYRAMARQGEREPAPAPKPGWYMLGAVVEAPSSYAFFKLTGPAATVKSAREPFKNMIATIAKP